MVSSSTAVWIAFPIMSARRHGLCFAAALLLFGKNNPTALMSPFASRRAGRLPSRGSSSSSSTRRLVTFIDNNSPFELYSAGKDPQLRAEDQGSQSSSFEQEEVEEVRPVVLTPEEEKQLKVDEWHMHCALHLASSAAAEGEVPVGAVLLAPNGTVLARAHNMV